MQRTTHSHNLPGTGGLGRSSSSPTGGSVQMMLRGRGFDEQSALLSPVQAKGDLAKPGAKSRLAGKRSSYNVLYKTWRKWQKAEGTTKSGLRAELLNLIDGWLVSHADATSKKGLARLESLRQLRNEIAPPTPPPKTVDLTPDIEDDEEDTTTPPMTTPPPTLSTPPLTTTSPPKTDTTPTTTSPPKTDTTPTTTSPPSTDGKPTPAEINDKTIVFTVAQLKKLSYSELITYLDTRDRSVVESLRTSGYFTIHLRKFSAKEVAQVAVRIILRVPTDVVDKGGSRDEALRILSSQLNDKEMALRLISSQCLVVIVPKNKLMTDLPEFASSKGTFTFDGRPWDTTRGLGGKTTAITEENLTGDDIDKSPTMSRNGQSGTAYAGVQNPEVYCSGYSTTNHEFFHTLHKNVMSKSDYATVKNSFNDKKSRDGAATLDWADGPRLNGSGAITDNYSSTNEFEYFAQTGCAWQGTNAGTDAYTGNERNNGRGWVEKNEPKAMVDLYKRMCGSDALKKVNPRNERAAKKTTTSSTSTTPTTPVPTPGLIVTK